MTPQPGTALLPASATGSASLEEEAAAAAAAGGLEYAKEILITKSELEEKNQLVANLQNQVEETRTESEYQMRLKDNHYKEEQAKARKQFGQQISGICLLTLSKGWVKKVGLRLREFDPLSQVSQLNSTRDHALQH